MPPLTPPFHEMLPFPLPGSYVVSLLASSVITVSYQFFDLMTGKRSLLRNPFLRNGFAREIFFISRFVSLAAESSSFEHARQVLDETPERTTSFKQNTILKRFSRDKNWENTLCLFGKMVSGGKPDNFSIPVALKACAGLREVPLGQMIHGFVKKKTFGFDVFVGSALIEMYMKCGEVADALRVFEEFGDRADVVMWTSMVSGYEQNGFADEAVAFFARMVNIENVTPDLVTFISLLSACTKLSSLRFGRCVHGFVIRRGYKSNLSLANSLLNFYAKMGASKNAVNLFRMMPEKDVVSWSSTIACYARNGAITEALDLFNEMVDKGVEPNAVTMVSVLQACAVARDLEVGRKIYELAVKKGFEADVMVSTALIHMFMKCSSPNEALDVFSRMPNKDVVSWNALISGYALNGMAYKSMEVFRNMMSAGIKSDAIVIVKVLGSCSDLGVYQQAICLHGYIIRSGFDDNLFVGACLIELYSKCGCLDNAIRVFKEITVKDVVIWSSMITSYGIHGKGLEALKTFDQMVKNSSARPNHVTFLSILSACSHAGLIREGFKIFETMVNEHKLVPNSEHYCILVDLLGRGGDLDKAIEIINRMPVSPGPHVWGALLGACRIHRNIEVAEIAANNLFSLESDHAGYYILLSNTYGLEGEWDNMAKLRNLVKDKGIKKVSAQSSVVIRGKIHGFVADERLHPDVEVTSELLRQLGLQMKDEVCSSDMGDISGAFGTYT